MFCLHDLILLVMGGTPSKSQVLEHWLARQANQCFQMMWRNGPPELVALLDDELSSADLMAEM